MEILYLQIIHLFIDYDFSAIIIHSWKIFSKWEDQTHKFFQMQLDFYEY